MATRELPCPQCGLIMRLVSRPDGYFCAHCLGALTVVNATYGLWMCGQCTENEVVRVDGGDVISAPRDPGSG